MMVVEANVKFELDEEQKLQFQNVRENEGQLSIFDIDETKIKLYEVLEANGCHYEIRSYTYTTITWVKLSTSLLELQMTQLLTCV